MVRDARGVRYFESRGANFNAEAEFMQPGAAGCNFDVRAQRCSTGAPQGQDLLTRLGQGVTFCGASLFPPPPPPPPIRCSPQPVPR